MLTASSAPEAETPSTRRFFDNAASLSLLPLALGPLSDGESAELVELLLADGGDPGPAIRRAVLAGGRGNPMVLELLVGDWRRRGDGCLALSVSAMTPRAERPPKETFQRLVEGTLAALNGEERSVVELAAILGQRLNDLTMYTMVDLPVARTMRAMTALLLINGSEPADDIFVPGKLYDYLMARRPILFVGNQGDAWRIVEQSCGPGRCFTHAEPAALAAAIAALTPRPAELPPARQFDAAATFAPLLALLERPRRANG